MPAQLSVPTKTSAATDRPGCRIAVAVGGTINRPIRAD
jgi:hypothetical protein